MEFDFDQPPLEPAVGRRGRNELCLLTKIRGKIGLKMPISAINNYICIQTEINIARIKKMEKFST